MILTLYLCADFLRSLAHNFYNQCLAFLSVFSRSFIVFLSAVWVVKRLLFYYPTDPFAFLVVMNC